MSRHVPLFPVDSEVLGKVVAPVFFPSVNPPDCFAQGLLKADGTLDPSVPSTVVKFINLGSPQFRVFALHGKFSRHGVMSSEVHPAVLLWATFNGEHISDARFGTIEPINKANKYAHIPLEIHATFGMSTHGQSRRYTHPSRLLHQPEQARWRCTEVVISDPTFSSPFFRYDCTTEETFVEFIAIDANADAPFGGPGGGGGGRFDEYVPPSHRITITPDRGTISMNVTGSKIMPSVNEVKQAEEMFMKCDALLQSKFGVIEWLEDHRVERREQPEHPVNAVFKWMNEFQSAMLIPIPSIKDWERYFHLEQSARKQLVYNRFNKIREETEAKAKKMDSRARKGFKKSLKAEEHSSAVSDPKPASAFASAASASVKATITKPDTHSSHMELSSPGSHPSLQEQAIIARFARLSLCKKGGKTRKRRHRGL